MLSSFRQQTAEMSSSLQRQSKRVKFVREIVKEVAGLAPYERRVTELLKTGRDKRALKLCKRKVDSFPNLEAERASLLPLNMP